MKGCLAFIDILGFSALKNEDFSYKFVTYHEIVNAACKNPVHYRMYSDSLILYTEALTKDHLMKQLSAVSEITYGLLMQLDIPVRGCVSAGDFTVNKGGESVVIAGKPLIDAYGYEKKQDWVGTMLSPQLVKLIDKEINLESVVNITTRSKADAKDLEERLPWSMLIQRCHTIPYRQTK